MKSKASADNRCGGFSFFMRSPMQMKSAAKAAHGARSEQGRGEFPLDCISPMQMKNTAKAAHGARNSCKINLKFK